MALVINSGSPSYVLSAAISSDSGTASGSVTTSGSNRVGYVAIGCSLFAGTPMSVTWDGVSMTLVEDRHYNNSYAALFKIVAPATTGSTIAWSGGNSSLGGLVAFSTQDNDQTTPTGTTAENDAASLSIPSATGEIAIAAIFTYSGSGTTVDSPATMIGTANVGSFNGSVAQISGTSPTATITFNGSSPMVGVSLKPVSGSSTVTTPFFTRFIANGSQI